MVLTFHDFLYIMTLINISLGACVYRQIPASQCPPNPNLPECLSNMTTGSLCVADQTLPDGNSNFDVDNCPYGYDVFICIRGGKPFIDIISSYQLSFSFLHEK